MIIATLDLNNHDIIIWQSTVRFLKIGVISKDTFQIYH